MFNLKEEIMGTDIKISIHEKLPENAKSFNIHYLLISNWILLTFHFLLKICKNTRRIILKL